MSVSLYGYVERKNDDGKWELVTKEPVSKNLKYIMERYHEFSRLDWNDVSDGLKEIFKKDEDGISYVTFYVTTIEEIESEINSSIKSIFTRLNMVIKALGGDFIYSDDGEELDWGTDEKDTRELTYPINRSLLEDLQYGYSLIRKVGNKEAFDLFVNDHIEYGKEHRIVLAAH